MTEAEAVRAAERTIAAGSRSFAAAARLFDRPTRDSAVLLYAWCRHCDDVIDGQELGFAASGARNEGAAERLGELERETRAALAGAPSAKPAFAALRVVMRRHDIPERLPFQHLAGFRMDVEGRRYETISDTLDYAYHVAGVVGVMMAYVMGVRDPATLDRASDLGIAFQLSNIARDLVEDARVGRVYTPSAWLAEVGLSPDGIADPSGRERLAVVAARLVAAAEPYYDSAAIGVRALPARSAWAIAAARRLYRAIGREVVRRGARAWDSRVSTSSLAKLAHVAAASPELVRGSLSWAPAPARLSELYARPR